MGCTGCVRKVVKSIVGMDIALPQIIESRREVCRSCEFAVPCPTNKKRKCLCSKCGCVLQLKTRLRDEKCPEGYW